MRPTPPHTGFPLALILAALVGCAAPADPSARRLADAAAAPPQRSAPVLDKPEPAPVPGLSDERSWRYGPSPARLAYGWPDRFTGVPTSGPFRQRF